LELQEFIDMVRTLLHEPQTQDILVIKRNLNMLCDHVGVNICGRFGKKNSMLARLERGQSDAFGDNVNNVMNTQLGAYTKQASERTGGGGLLNLQDSDLRNPGDIARAIQQAFNDGFADLETRIKGDTDQALARVEESVSQIRDALLEHAMEEEHAQNKM
jgi:hypothetical protein